MDGQHCRLMLMMMVVVGMTVVVVPDPVQQLKQNNEIDNVKTTMPHDRSYATPTSNTPSDEGYSSFVPYFSDGMEEMSVTSSKIQFLTSISFIQRNDGFSIHTRLRVVFVVRIVDVVGVGRDPPHKRRSSIVFTVKTCVMSEVSVHLPNSVCVCVSPNEMIHGREVEFQHSSRHLTFLSLFLCYLYIYIYVSFLEQTRPRKGNAVVRARNVAREGNYRNGKI